MNDQPLPPGSPQWPENGPYWLWSALTGMSAPPFSPSSPFSPSWPPFSSRQSGDQSIASAVKIPSGGILGDFGSAANVPSGGILGNFGQSVDELSANPWMAPKGPSGWHLPMSPFPSVLPSVPPPDSWNPSGPTLRHPTTGVNAALLSSPTQATDPWPENSSPTASNAPKPPPAPPTVPFYGPNDVLMPRPEPGPPAPPKDFRTWLRDSLSDDNVRYYLGPHLFEVLRKIHSLTQLLPGSGSVQSMEDSARANEELQQGNYGNAAAHLGMGTLNAGLDWVPPRQDACDHRRCDGEDVPSGHAADSDEDGSGRKVRRRDLARHWLGACR
jgi:hypothetical protein